SPHPGPSSSFPTRRSSDLYLASADWTARNFFRRVEICFPVDDRELCKRLDQVVAIYWKDNVKAREQSGELSYVRKPLEGDPVNAQAIFLEKALKQEKPTVPARSRTLKAKGDIKVMEHRQKVGQPA